MTAPERLQPAALDTAFDLAAAQVETGSVPFVILAVADRRGVVRAEAFAGPTAPGVQLDAVCLLASITKPLLATAIMQLVANGQVALTDPVEGSSRSSPLPVSQQVTVWHLLTHTSGIPDVDLGRLLREGVRREDLLRQVTSAPLHFLPGTRFEYVSSTFDLLAGVIEQVTGESHVEHLRRAVLEPLRMVDTTFDPWDRLAGRVAPLAAAAVPGSEGPGGRCRSATSSGARSPPWRRRARGSSAPPPTWSGSAGRCCGAVSSTASGSCRRPTWS